MELREQLLKHRKDDRFPSDPSTQDYGANVFGRYRVGPSLFFHGECLYELCSRLRIHGPPASSPPPGFGGPEDVIGFPAGVQPLSIAR